MSKALFTQWKQAAKELKNPTLRPQAIATLLVAFKTLDVALDLAPKHQQARTSLAVADVYLQNLALGQVGDAPTVLLSVLGQFQKMGISKSVLSRALLRTHESFMGD